MKHVLDDKRPNPVTQRIMNWTDVVVILGTGIFPRAYMPTHIWDFEDPTTKSIDQVRELRDEIRSSVEQLISEIKISDLKVLQMSQIVPPHLEPVWN